MSARKRLSQKRVIEALHKTKGAVYLAAKMLDASHTAIYNYVNKYPKVAMVKEYYDNEMIDIAELGLMDALKKGEAWAIKYTLSTKGKGRGYVERQEIAHAGDLKVEIEYVNDPYPITEIPPSTGED